MVLPALAAGIVASGTYGDNLTWTLDDAGTLTISGTGKMADISAAGPTPWKRNKDIKTVNIQSGVTNICYEAFLGCSGIISVTIPDSMSGIGQAAFVGCTSITSVTIPSSATYIDSSSFANCTGLVSITIPDSVTWIGWSAFSGCSALTDVYYGGSEVQWNAITIKSGNEPLTNARIHYNSSDPEPAPPTPAYAFPSAPTISGGASITRANVGTLTEVIVSVAYSGNAAQTVTFAVPFYDGSGKFIGVGMKTETVTSPTQSVTVPVSGLSGSESMKVMILGDTFNPLSPVGSYSLPA